MRDAAADLDFETAARLRDEIKRLREMELAISDDPLAREVEGQSPVSGREKGKHNKGRAHAPERFDDEAREAAGHVPQAGARRDGRRRRHAGQASRCSRSPRSTTWARAPTCRRRPAPSRARCSRSSRTTRRTAPTTAFPAMRDQPLFRKNSLDEMTVRRTEKPVEGKTVQAADQSARQADRADDARPSTASAPASAPTKTPPTPARKTPAGQDGQAGTVAAMLLERHRYSHAIAWWLPMLTRVSLTLRRRCCTFLPSRATSQTSSAPRHFRHDIGGREGSPTPIAKFDYRADSTKSISEVDVSFVSSRRMESPSPRVCGQDMGPPACAGNYCGEAARTGGTGRRDAIPRGINACSRSIGVTAGPCNGS